MRATTEAVRRINADKRSYVRYFLQDFRGAPEVDALTPEDFDLARIQLKAPHPIPEAEARWDWEWMSSWGLLNGSFDVATQLNAPMQEAAHSEPARLVSLPRREPVVL